MNMVGEIVSQALEAGESTLSEYDSKSILAAYGIPVVEEVLVEELPQAREAAGRLGYPLAMKVCAAGLAHKTEQNLLELNLQGEGQLERAFERLHPRAVSLGGKLLVQQMVGDPREFVLGMTRDPLLGPCVMFGLGGIFTEALDDVAFRLAPLGHEDARQMLEEIKGRRLLGPLRGMEAVDREALVRALVNLGRLALDHPAIREVDINPLRIAGGSPVAVDALVVVEKPRQEAKPASRRGGLEAFFQPRSVAVIGATAKPHKAGNDVVRNILANHFDGELHLVNPKGGEILGLPVHRSIDELPEGVELAIIILPAAANPQAIRQCAARGIKAVVLAAGGFAEVDQKGRDLEQEMLEAVRESGIRVLGPNTSGHSSTPHHFTSSFFPLGKLPRGPISYIAQTGNFSTHTMRYIQSAEHYGVARVVGLGNKLDLEESEVLEYLGDDPETKAVFMYLESLKWPRRFFEVASRVTRRKPVVLLKGGASAEGARAAVAHTAALASDDRLVDAALRQAGVVRIHQYSHLILAAKALATMPLPQGNRVGFLAPSGAMLVCLTDLCHRHLGLTVPRIASETQQRLQEISPPYIRMRNPVDIWPCAATSGVEFAYREGAEAILKDPVIDAVVMVLMLTDETGVPPLDFVPELAARYPHKPIYVTFSGQKKHMEAAKEFLEPRGVPTFPFIEQPFEVLSILARCRRFLERP